MCMKYRQRSFFVCIFFHFFGYDSSNINEGDYKMKVLKRVKIAYSIVSLTLLLYGFFLAVYPQLGLQV